MTDESFAIPSEDDWLKILDGILSNRYHSTLVTELKLPEAQADCLATTMLGELQQLNSNERKMITDALLPLSVSDLATQQRTVSAMRYLAIFADHLDEKSRRDNKPQAAAAVIASIQLSIESYFVFVYLKESLIYAILALAKTHNSLALVKASQRLMRDDVNNFRNAFAHASWAVKERNGSTILKGWDSKSSRTFEITSDELNFLRLIAFAISAVVVKELR